MEFVFEKNIHNSNMVKKYKEFNNKKELEIGDNIYWLYPDGAFGGPPLKIVKEIDDNIVSTDTGEYGFKFYKKIKDNGVVELINDNQKGEHWYYGTRELNRRYKLHAIRNLRETDIEHLSDKKLERILTIIGKGF